MKYGALMFSASVASMFVIAVVYAWKLASEAKRGAHWFSDFIVECWTLWVPFVAITILILLLNALGVSHEILTLISYGGTLTILLLNTGVLMRRHHKGQHQQRPQ